MRTSLYFLMVLLALASCSKQEQYIFGDNGDSLRVLSASFLTDNETKTMLVNRKTLWSPYDSITVVSGGEVSKFYSRSEVACKTTSFYGQMGQSSTNEFAVYPSVDKSCLMEDKIKLSIPACQSLPKNSVPANTLVSLAPLKHDNLVFTTACSVIGFKIQNEGISRIYVKGTNGEVLAGIGLFGIDEREKPGLYDILTEEQMLTLSPLESECFIPGEWYYFPVFPTIIDNGILFIFEKGGKYGSKYYHDTRTLFSGECVTFSNLDEYLSIGSYNIYPTIVNKNSVTLALTVPLPPNESFSMSGHFSLYKDGVKYCNIYMSSYGAKTGIVSGLNPDTEYEFSFAGVSRNVKTLPDSVETTDYGYSSLFKGVSSSSATYRFRFQSGHTYYYTLDNSDPDQDNGIQIQSTYADGSYHDICFSGLTPNNKYVLKIRGYYSDGTPHKNIGTYRFETLAAVPSPHVTANVCYIDQYDINLEVTCSRSTAYYLVYKGYGTDGEYKKYTSSGKVYFESLTPSTKYQFTIVPYNSENKAGDAVHIEASTLQLPYDNYFYYKGNFYEITSISMTTDRPGGTKANWSNLRFNTSNGSTFVKFYYSRPYYEGISSEWPDGTYTIKSSGNYYQYICCYNYGTSSVKYASGKLTIKTINKIRTYSFELKDSSTDLPVRGFCIGNLN